MPTVTSPQQPETEPGPRRADDGSRRRQHYRSRAKALIWRAALGAAYAAGTGVVTIAVKWLVTLI